MSALQDEKFGDAKQRRIYINAMEHLGEAVVSHRLASRMPVGDHPEDNPPVEMANIWLQKKRTMRLRFESLKYWLGIVIGIAAAVAAIIAAAPVVKDWLK